MNLLLIGALAVGSYLAFNKAMDVNTFKEALNYEWAVKNFRFHTWKEIRFELDLKILNPSNISIRIENPLIQVFYENTFLMRSVYNIPEISIKANSYTQLPRIEFRLDLLANIFTIKAMLGKLMKGVTFNNLSNLKEIITANTDAFFKLLDVKVTGRLNGTPYTQTFKLG